MKKILYIFGVAILALESCQHQMVAPGTSDVVVAVTNPGNGISTTDTVSFQSEVLPLYQSYCGSAGCHNASSSKEGVVLTDYFNIMKGIRANSPSSSKYYTVIGGKMPPRNSPQLSSVQMATILKWINQSALNTAYTTTVCDTTQTTYTNGISQIFSTYCNGCHGTAPGSGNIVLANYTSAKNVGTVLKQNFLNAINYTAATASKNMPPLGKISSCQITQIKTWINNGCPQ